MIKGQVVDGLFLRSRVLPIELDRAGQKRNTILDFSSPLTGGSTIYDVSGKGNNGVITGATWTKLPSGLWGLSFAGVSDKVTVLANAGFDVGASTDFTVICWAKGLAGNDASAEVVQRFDTHYWQIRGAAGNFRLIINGAGGATESTSTVSVTDNLWHFVAGVRVAGGTTFLQIDGTVTDTDADIAGALTLTDDVKIGGGETAFWKGDIVLVRYLTIGLSALQLTSIYNQERHLFGL